MVKSKIGVDTRDITYLATETFPTIVYTFLHVSFASSFTEWIYNIPTCFCYYRPIKEFIYRQILVTLGVLTTFGHICSTQ